LSQSASRALGAIKGKFKSLKNVGYNTFRKLYYSGVVPITEYGSCIWGLAKASDIDKVQNKAMRYFLGVHRYTPICGMRADMGWLKPIYGRYNRVFKYWNKLILMDDNRLTKAVFNMIYDKSKDNWCSRIKELFNEQNISETYENKAPCLTPDVNLFYKTKSNRETLAEINSKPKLRTYRLFKDNVSAEGYVKYSVHRKKRSLMAQLRLGVLPLKIETGRYQNTPEKERTCDACSNTIENEIHFMFECPQYSPTRDILLDAAKLYNTDFDNLNVSDKLNILLNTLWKDSSKFVLEAWNTRNNLLYVD